MRDGVDFSPYRIAYHVDLQNTPAWFEQRRPQTWKTSFHTPTSCWSGWPRGLGTLNPSPHSLIFTSTLADSRPRSYSFTFSLVYQKQWNQNLFDMQRSSFKIGAAQPRSFTETRHAETAVLMCEPTPYPMWFSSQRVSFRVADIA